MEISKNKRLIVQKDDIKSRKWREASNVLGLKVDLLNGSPIRAPLMLLLSTFQRKKPRGYLARYLNDYPSLAKTLLRTISEIILIGLCKLLKVKLFWLCHNVDKETDRYYPSISNFRRFLFARYSERIFVTDSLLKEKASATFPKSRDKIDNISFGQANLQIEGSGDCKSIEFLTELRKRSLERGRKFLSLLCAGYPNNPKYLHFTYLIDLIDNSEKNGYDIGVVVAGNWDGGGRNQELLAKYRSNSNIVVFEKYTTFSTTFIRNNIDFYFRGYGDYSVPFTVYEACTLGKPILALDNGFLPKMVRHYKIGQVVDMDFNNINEVLDMLLLTEDKAYREFLEKNNWSVFGKKMNQLL